MTVEALANVTTPAPMAPSALRSTSLVFLQRRIVRAVARVTDDPSDLMVRRAVTLSVDAFLRADGRPEPAAARTRLMMRQLGAEQFCAGRTVEEVDAVFGRIHGIVLGAVTQLVGSDVVGQRMLSFRFRLKQFLHLQCQHTVGGLLDERTRQLRGGVASHVPRGSAGLSGPPRDGLWRAVVSVDLDLPEALRRDPLVVTQSSPLEALVPASFELDHLAELLTDQVVIGPATSWARAPQATALAWRGAGLLREGLAFDDRLMVPCSDLAGALLVSGNTVMSDLLVTKHLSDLEAVQPARRADLAEALLHWLERNLPANTLARELGIPPQTFHGRLNAARDLVGDAIDDPAQRLELIVALRAAIPHWNLVD